jgi:hypothetical protein
MIDSLFEEKEFGDVEIVEIDSYYYTVDDNTEFYFEEGKMYLEYLDENEGEVVVLVEDDFLENEEFKKYEDDLKNFKSLLEEL